MSTDGRIDDYSEFVEALASVGVEATCAQSSKYCYVGKTSPLHVLPTPRFLSLVKRFNPDFVLTDSPYYLPQLAKLVARRCLLHMRGDPWSELYFDRMMFPSFFERTYTRYLATITDRSIRETDLILAVSKWLEKQVGEHLQTCPTQVLYVGIDPMKWDPKHNTRRIRTLGVKHPAVVGVFPFNQYAKVSGLLKFTKVIRKMKDVNFYFAGDGPYFDLVRQECPSNMFLLGKVSGTQIKGFLETGDVFVHPSGLDALPRCVKEASLMEKPIVASDEGGIPEIVRNGQTGYLCDMDDTDQWIARIRFLIDNPDVARQLGKNARQFVIETFDWRKIAEGFLKTLNAFRD